MNETSESATISPMDAPTSNLTTGIMVNTTTNTNTVTATATATTSKPLWYYDNLVAKALADGTAQYLDQSNVLELQEEGVGSGAGDDSRNIYVGHILALIPESRNGEPDDIKRATSSFIAVQDFNNRISRFPHYPNVTTMGTDLANLTEGCNFYMTLTVRDSGRDFFVAGKSWQDAFFDEPLSGRHRMPPPMAVVGASASYNSAMLATLGAVTTTGDWMSDSNTTTTTTANAGIVTISPSSTAAYLDNKQRYPYFARTSLNTAQITAESAMYYMEYVAGVRQFAILHVDSGLAVDTLEYLLREAALNYAHIDIYVVSYVENDAASMARAAELLKGNGMIYHLGIQPSEAMILQLRDAGMIGYMNNKSYPNTTWAFIGAVVAGMMNEEQQNNEDRLGDLHQAMHQSITISTSRRDEVSEIRGNNSDILLEEMKAFHNDSNAIAYLRSRHLGTGIFGANPKLYYDMLDTEDFLHPDKAKRTRTYDAVLALGIAACQQIANTTSKFTTPAYFETLKRVQFAGVTGQVAFNTTTGSRAPDAVATKFRTVLLIEDTEINSSTLIRNLSLTIWKNEHMKGGFDSLVGDSPIIYADGSTTPPPSIPAAPPEDMNLVPLGLRAFCWSTAGLVVLLSLACAFWTLSARKRPKLQASQPVFLVLLCLGTLLMGCSIVPMTWQEPISSTLLDVGCMLQVWLLSIGFSTTFAALFSKTWRITRLYNNALKMRRTQVLASHVFWVPTTVFILNVASLTIWTILDPLKWNRVVLEVDKFDRVVESKGTCFDNNSESDGSKHQSSSIIFGALIILINFLSFFVSGIQSYRARELPSSFNESFYIAISNCVILEAFLIGIPLLSVLNVNTSAYMVVGCWVIAIAALAVLIPMFWPKISAKDQHGRVSVKSSQKRTVALSSSTTNRSHVLKSSSKYEHTVSSPLSETSPSNGEQCPCNTQ